MKTKEYILTWQWKCTHTTNSFNTLSTTNKQLVDKYLKDIEKQAVNIHLLTYD